MIRVAVIGVGHWHTPLHMHAIASADARVVAVCDERAEAARVWGERLGCARYPSTESLLEAGGFDFAFALPVHDAAARVASTLLEQGVPFLAEKPLGLNAGEIEPIVGLQARTGGFAAVAFSTRYGLFWDELRALQAAGGLDGVVHASLRIVGATPERYRDFEVPWMLDPARAGGGPLRNLGSHLADAAVALSGDRPEVLSAHARHSLHGLGIEDHIVATVRLANGAIATIESGYTNADAGYTDRESLFATRERYVVDRGDRVRISTPAGTTERLGPSDQEMYRRLGVDALERFRDQRAPLAGVDDCWRAQALVDEIYRAAGEPFALDALAGPGG